MKYIDAERLLAAIERRMKDYNASIEKHSDNQKSIKAERDSWRWAECKWFLNLIFSLQQEQPECLYGKTLEEREKYCKFCAIICEAKIKREQPKVDYNKFEKLFYDFCERNKGHHITSHDACMWFWELGLKARKEE